MHADEDPPIEGLSSIAGLFRGGDCSVHVLKPSPNNGCSHASSYASATQHLSTDEAAAATAAAPAPAAAAAAAVASASTSHSAAAVTANASNTNRSSNDSSSSANTTDSLNSGSGSSNAQTHAAERAAQQAACSSNYADSDYSSGESPASDRRGSNRGKGRIRPVAPPFLDWRELFPELSLLLQPQNFADILQEALSVKSAWKVSTTCSTA
jgi:hypothetical protein